MSSPKMSFASNETSHRIQKFHGRFFRGFSEFQKHLEIFQDASGCQQMQIYNRVPVMAFCILGNWRKGGNIARQRHNGDSNSDDSDNNNDKKKEEEEEEQKEERGRGR